DERGFVFFTNYDSRKAAELAANPWAALAFYWAPLDRQVRVEGRGEGGSAAGSGAHLRAPARGRPLGGWASAPSAAIDGRDVPERGLREAGARFAGGEVPGPPNWGGSGVRRALTEFWQSGPDRLHDRLCYVRQEDGTWRLQRLAP